MSKHKCLNCGKEYECGNPNCMGPYESGCCCEECSMEYYGKLMMERTSHND